MRSGPLGNNDHYLGGSEDLKGVFKDGKASEAAKGRALELAWRASEPDERASKPAEGALAPAERASKQAGWASKQAGRASKPTLMAAEPAEKASEPAGRASKGAIKGAHVGDNDQEVVSYVHFLTLFPQFYDRVTISCIHIVQQPTLW